MGVGLGRASLLHRGAGEDRAGRDGEVLTRRLELPTKDTAASLPPLAHLVEARCDLSLCPRPTSCGLGRLLLRSPVYISRLSASSERASLAPIRKNVGSLGNIARKYRTKPKPKPRTNSHPPHNQHPPKGSPPSRARPPPEIRPRWRSRSPREGPSRPPSR